MKKFFLPVLTAALLFSACNDASNTTADATDKTPDSASMSQEDKEERNKKIALESMEAINAHNVDEAFKNNAADAVDYGEGSAPPVRNVDSMKAGMKYFMESFPDIKGENLQAVADGDYVYVYGDWSGTFKKDLGNIKATNKAFKIKDVDIFKFNDEGKMIEHRAIVPWSVVFDQVGAKQK